MPAKPSRSGGPIPNQCVLVANRGEIAIRVFRSAKALGFRTVAIYSDADAGAPFVRFADEAVNVGPPPAVESYLNIEAVIEAAIGTGATLVHPGYGFLSENELFAQACAKEGLIFVGPSPEVLRLMGSKDLAKRAAAEAGVPVLEGYSGSGSNDEPFISAASRIGYPVIVKPIAGGGGKGMVVARSDEELLAGLASARRIGQAAFGDEAVLIERYVQGPRHVEVQVLADVHGNVIHLGERDCSLQRRHQKILEESPSPVVDDALRQEMTVAAVSLARHVGYTNAGTVEFIVGDDLEFAFLEMNTRLQVEHPVTEMVTGIDLVAHQLMVALGEPLSIGQDDVRTSGHAIEVRLYAEDPAEGFLPQAGTVEHLRWPADVRIDTGIEEGTEVPAFYDPMLAKLIVHGSTRAEALSRISTALDQVEILGIGTNVAFLSELVGDPVVTAGRVTTDWLSTRDASQLDLVEGDPVSELAAAAVARDLLRARSGADPFERLGGFRLSGRAPLLVVLQRNGGEVVVELEGDGPWIAGGFRIEELDGCHGFAVSGDRAAAAVAADEVFVWWAGSQHRLTIGPRTRRLGSSGGHLGSPMPGQVIAVKVAAGDRVAKGQALVVVEAMKMEHTVVAPADGTVTAVLCGVGDRVGRGATLVDIEAD